MRSRGAALHLLALGACASGSGGDPQRPGRCHESKLFGLTDSREPPLGDEVSAGSIRNFAGDEGDLRELRGLLDGAESVPPCDPSISAWQYSPRFQGSFETSSGRFSVRAFLGGRVVLGWPDGALTMFDAGVPRWASARTGPYLRRARGQDARCSGEASRRRFFRYDPGPTHGPAELAELALHCARQGPDRGMNIAAWCCE